MNRKERRTLIRNARGKKGLRKKHTKGAFGELPLYLQHYRREQFTKEAQKYLKTLENTNQETVETEEVTTIIPSK